MEKAKSTALPEKAFADRASDKDNAVKIPYITFQEQFKYFADEVSPFLGGAKMGKYHGKDVSGTFLPEDMFVYPMAFRVGIKLPLNPMDV